MTRDSGEQSYFLKCAKGDGAAEVISEFEAETLYVALAHARASVTDRDIELWHGGEKLYDLRLLRGGVWQFFPAHQNVTLFPQQ